MGAPLEALAAHPQSPVTGREFTGIKRPNHLSTPANPISDARKILAEEKPTTGIATFVVGENAYPEGKIKIFFYSKFSTPFGEQPITPKTEEEHNIKQDTPEAAQGFSASQAKELLRDYANRKEKRLDIEHDPDIQDLIEGVERFKKYNVHEQIHDDPQETGAIGLGPGYFRVPNHDRYPFLFLHDFYFMSKGDKDTKEGRELIESGLDKLVFLYDQYKMFPNFSGFSALNASARPLFIPTVMEWYKSHPEKDSKEVKEKFKNYMNVGADEHDNIWNNHDDLKKSIGTNHHMVAGYRWLRRAGDKDIGEQYNASREIGWDESHGRFGGSEDAVFPICMNAILVKNKMLLAEAAKILDTETLGGRTAEEWMQQASEMNADINELFYDPDRGTFFDYDFEDMKQRQELTLASAWTLYSDTATGEQALSVIGNLLHLDSGNGLTVTAMKDHQKDPSDDELKNAGLHPKTFKAIHRLNKPANWDGNVWPPELIATTEGMLNYIRFRKEGDKGLNPKDRLAITRFAISQIHNQLRVQMKIFKEKNGKFPEKWRADGTDDNGHYHYEPQENGIGWSATLAELNVKVFLPELYRLEDELALMTGEKENLPVETSGTPQDIFVS